MTKSFLPQIWCLCRPFLPAAGIIHCITWDGLYCLLPCLSMACTTLALWTHNMPRTRLLFLLNSPPLLAYNLITGAYSCALVEVCALISFAVAIYRFDLRGKKARLPQR